MSCLPPIQFKNRFELLWHAGSLTVFIFWPFHVWLWRTREQLPNFSTGGHSCGCNASARAQSNFSFGRRHSCHASGRRGAKASHIHIQSNGRLPQPWLDQPWPSLRCVLEGVLVGVWSNNLLADANRICECVLVSVLRLEFYKMSRWSLLPCLNEWSEPVGTQREICG